MFDLGLFSMRKYLLAKHWHYFIAAFILPLSILTLGILLPFYVLNGATIFIAVPLSILVSQMVLYFWLWNIGKMLFDKTPFYISKEYVVFKWLIIIPASFILFISFFLLIGAAVLGMGYFSFSTTLFSSMIIILPLWILLLLTKLYCFYFAAKVLKSSELQRNVQLFDFLGDFLLFVFFPIGIWFIQPRLNRLVHQMDGK